MRRGELHNANNITEASRKDFFYQSSTTIGYCLISSRQLNSELLKKITPRFAKSKVKF